MSQNNEEVQMDVIDEFILLGNDCKRTMKSLRKNQPLYEPPAGIDFEGYGKMMRDIRLQQDNDQIFQQSRQEKKSKINEARKESAEDSKRQEGEKDKKGIDLLYYLNEMKTAPKIKKDTKESVFPTDLKGQKKKKQRVNTVIERRPRPNQKTEREEKPISIVKRTFQPMPEQTQKEKQSPCDDIFDHFKRFQESQRKQVQLMMKIQKLEQRFNSDERSQKPRKERQSKQKKQEKKTIPEPQIATESKLQQKKKVQKQIPKPVQPLKPFKGKRERIDPRKLSLRQIIETYNSKLKSKELSTLIFPNLFGHEIDFSICYLNNKIDSSNFNKCILTPFDHRAASIILTHRFHKQFFIDESQPFPQSSDQPEELFVFYQNLYSLSQLEYYEKYLQIVLSYKRKSTRSLRVRLDEVMKEKLKLVQGQEKKDRKRIEEILERIDRSQKEEQLMIDIRRENQIKLTREGALIREDDQRKRHKMRNQELKSGKRGAQISKGDKEAQRSTQQANLKVPEPTKRVVVIDERAKLFGSDNQDESQLSLQSEDESEISNSQIQQSQISSSIESRVETDEYQRESDGSLSMGSDFNEESSRKQSQLYSISQISEQRQVRSKNQSQIESDDSESVHLSMDGDSH